MNAFLKTIIITMSLATIFSCTPSAPYEIKSPCVSVEGGGNNDMITPCVRRPVNLSRAIV